MKKAIDTLIHDMALQHFGHGMFWLLEVLSSLLLLAHCPFTSSGLEALESVHIFNAEPCTFAKVAISCHTTLRHL